MLFRSTGGVADTTATSRRGQVIVAPATGSSVSISTVQSAAKAGDVDLGTTQLTAATAGRDLTIDVSRTGQQGGTVTLGQVNSAGGTYLNDLTVTLFNATDTNSNQTAGVLKLTGDIALDNDGSGDAGSLVVSGGVADTTALSRRAQVVVAPDAKNASSTLDRKSTRLNSSHMSESRMPSSA